MLLFLELLSFLRLDLSWTLLDKIRAPCPVVL
jgi:hypothetical protein